MSSRPSALGRGGVSGLRVPRPETLLPSRRQQVSQLFPLGAQVLRVLLIRGGLDADTVLDPETVALEADELLGVVRDDADRPQAQVEQDLRADSVVAEVGLEAELLVG